MAFNSSVLSYDSDRHMTDMNNIVENARKSDSDLFVYSLLEFNDSVHVIDTIDKISYYKDLTEASGNGLMPVNEGIVEVVNALAKIIAKIINFLKDVSRKILNFSIFGKSRYNDLRKKNPKESEKSWANNPNITRQINVFHFPSVLDVDSQQFRTCLNNIINELERVCENDTNTTDKASNKSKEMAFKTLAKLIGKYVKVEGAPGEYKVSDVTDSRSFANFVNSEICFVTQKEMNYNEYYKHYMDLNGYMIKSSVYAKKVSEFYQDLERAKKIVSNAVINTPEQKKHAHDLVAQISSISIAYGNFIYSIANMENKCFDYHSKLAYKYIYNIEKDSVNEAGWIHGEQFDSDTLFDNEDLRDFNRTEWLDLNLTTECFESKYEILETSKRIALQEALILTDDLPNKFGRLVAMREAEEKKLSERLSNIIEVIRNALNKFMQTVKDKAVQQAAKLKNNATFVTKPIKIEHVKSNGDILAGMYRIQQKINILPFDYNSMKDDLKDKETFFRNRILSGMRNTSQYAKRQLNWNDGMSVVEYCKLYYGASLPEDKYPKCEFTTQDLEINKANIIKFLSTPNNAFSCKSDLDVLESESKKIARADVVQNRQQNTQTATQNAEQKPAATNTNTAKNEAYFSELYQTWFTEAEIEIGEKPAEAEQNNQEIADRATAYKIYMDTYKDIILSKMTAAEFIYSELTQIINAHAAYYAPKAKPAATTQNNPQSQTTPTQQQSNK